MGGGGCGKVGFGFDLHDRLNSAARALDDAVAVSVRRSHAQTTSLHAVSALLAPTTSLLREACTRSGSSEYPPRLQFRALELCVSVSLDKLPTSKSTEEPPVSNSLMAAIKRAQANQRRQPDSFQFYQQMQVQNQLGLSCVKVELKYFILSILDDPIVSRVFEEAGFRGSDIKLAILHPLPQVSRISQPRVSFPPLFMCDSSGSNSSRFNFPFVDFPGLENGDGNLRRIGEVLVKKKVKNPLLVGVCANDALGNFTEFIQRGKTGELPGEIEGLEVVCIAEEIIEFVVNGGSKEVIDLKFKEVSHRVESCSGCGVAVNYGELKVFVDGGSVAAINCVVERLSSLVVVNGGKLWLIGAAASDDTYKKFLARFPSIEKVWDLCVLPITSSKASIGGSSSKSSLMMGSFVPFGGFFPTPSELQDPVSSTSKSITRCDQCNEKYKQEASLILKGGSTISVADHQSTSLPFWLQKDDSVTIKKMDAVEANDGGIVLNARLTGLQRKWNDICERVHRTCSFQQNIPLVVGSYFLGYKGSQFGPDSKETNDKDSLLNESASINLSSCLPLDMQKVSPPRNFLPISSSSIISVTTDLGLGTLYASSQEEPRKGEFQGHKDRVQSFSGSASAEVNGVSKIASNCITDDRVQRFSGSICGKVNRVTKNASNCIDEKDFKYLWRVLAEKVGWQDEAICSISQTVSRCRSGHGKRCRRGDIWLGFLGPDKVGKKRIAEELAEIVFGSRGNLISVDLSSAEDGINDSNSVFYRQSLNNYDVKFRGKTVVDYIAGELKRKPYSVVFLENIDKADFVAQICLSQAIKTGKFQDSHMREVSINNMIFVTTSSIMKVDKEFISGKETTEFSEERILGAKCLQMQILVEHVTGDDLPRSGGSNVFLSPRKGNKRKLIDISDSMELERSLEKPKRACLDLNLPVGEMVEEDNGNGICDSDSSSEKMESGYQNFLEQVDEKVVFKPFDFDSLAEKILKKISLSLHKTIGFDVCLEIDTEVMVQILAADWLTGCQNEVENWVEKVLCRGFVEAHQKHGLKNEHVLKLVFLEGSLLVEEHDPRVCLPARITIK
ncbi:hypothetical protein LguiB_000700 [Lonicera macranthoides]